MVVFNQFESECNAIDLDTQLDTFSDYCSDTILRSAQRLFASLAGDAGLDDYWQLGSVQLNILWILFMFSGVIILINVLIAIVTDSHQRSTFQRYSHHARARIPILAKHSYLDTEAKKLSQRVYGNFKYYAALIVIFIFFLLFGFSYIATVRSISLSNEHHVSMSMEYFKTIALTVCYIIADVALIVTVIDWFHINIQCTCCNNRLVSLFEKPVNIVLYILIYPILGVKDRKSSYEECGYDHTVDNNILVSIKEMFEVSTNRVRADLQKLIAKMKKTSSLDNDLFKSGVSEFE